MTGDAQITQDAQIPDEPRFIGDLEQELRRSTPRVRRRQRRTAAMGAAGVLGLLAVGAGVLFDRGRAPEPQAVTTVAEESTDTSPAATESIDDDDESASAARDDAPADSAPQTVSLDPGPMEPRTGHSGVALPDGRLVFWGGELEGPNVGRSDLGWHTYTDGYVYEPTTGAWSEMAATDLLPHDERAAVVASLFGDEVLWFRGRLGAAWNWKTDTWRPLAEAPSNVLDTGIVGDNVFALGPQAMYDVRKDVWLTPLTLSENADGADTDGADTDDGDELKKLPGVTLTDDPNRRIRLVDVDERVFLVAPTGSVTELGPAGAMTDHPGLDRSAVQWFDSAWHDGRLVVADGAGSVQALDPNSGAWTELPAIPARFWKASPELASIGDDLVAFAGPAVALLQDDGWRPVPRSSTFGAEVSDGTRLWTHGLDQGKPSFVVLDPRELVSSAFVQIGDRRFDASGLEVRFEVDPTPANTTIHTPAVTAAIDLVLDGSGVVREDECTIRSVADLGPAPGGPLTDDEAIDLAVGANGTMVIAGDSETVTIACNTDAAVWEMAERLQPSAAELESTHYSAWIPGLLTTGAWPEQTEDQPVGLAAAGVRLVGPNERTTRTSDELRQPDGDTWVIDNIDILSELRDVEFIKAHAGLWLDCLSPSAPDTPEWRDAIAIVTITDLELDQACSSFAMILYVDHEDRIVEIAVSPGTGTG